jgi:isochorismate synthase
LYAGFIGKIGNKAPTELLVMLRCMQFTPSAALLYLGGGLTPDSNPQEEWNETEAKAQTLLSVLVKC